MKLEKFLANNEKLRCDCKRCDAQFDAQLSELQKWFPQFDFQRKGVAFLTRLTDTLGVAVTHPTHDMWVARLVINDNTALYQDGFDPVEAVNDLFLTLKDLKDVLSEETQQFLDEAFK